MKNHLVVGVLAMLCNSLFLQVSTSPIQVISELLEEAKTKRDTDITMAFSLASRALDTAQYYQIDSIKAQILIELAIGYSYQASYDQAFASNHQALEMAHHFGDTISMIDANNNLGIDSYYLEDYQKARSYFDRVLKLSLAIQNKERIANSYNNLGLVASEFQEYDLEESYYAKALAVFEEMNLPRGIAMGNLNLGTFYLNLKKLDQASYFLDRAVKGYEDLNHIAGLIDAKSSLVDLYTEYGDVDRAIGLAEESFQLAMENGFMSGRIHLLGLLIDLYDQKGDYKAAFNAIRNLKNLNDSLRSRETAEIIAELETKYEMKQHEQEIENLQMENQLSQLTIDAHSNQRNLLVLFVVLLFLLAVFLFWQYRFKQKTNRLLAENNATISRTLEEREVLLKEIHHRVKNNLQVISSLLSLQSKFIKDQGAVDAVKEGQNRVKSMALIHQKLYQEDNLAGVKAFEYFESLTRSLIKSYGSETHVSIDSNGLMLDIDTAIPMGLILNEVISNSLKYAFNKDEEGLISVYLVKKQEHLLLEISDNGKGFNPEKVDSTSSFGMTLIKSLSQKLKATYNIHVDAGTRYSFNIKNYRLI